MKTHFNISILFFILLLFASCAKEEHLNDPSIYNANQSKQQSDKQEKHIYYASWDEWGHGADCGGWGLCNFEDCWTCCTQGGAIVDCDNSQAPPNAGVVLIDSETNIGHLIIELDVTDPEQLDAKNNMKTLTIDTNLSHGNIVLSAGAYPYLPSVGSDGGYKVNARYNP